MELIKHNEKVLIWLHRKNKSMKWLGDELGITRQAVSQKIKDNQFLDKDLAQLKILGYKY